MKGFSGGSVEVRVKKRAADKSKNTRLDYEITRLNHIGKEYGPYIRTPKIYQDSRILIDGVMSYEMEYIQGQRLEDALLSMPVSAIQDVAKTLADFIEQCANHKPVPYPRGLMIKPEEQFIRWKLQNAAEAIDPEWPESDAFIDIIQWVELKDSILTTMCHGDLALDNILINNDRVIGDFRHPLYLIDALSQDFDNYHWDIAKILQSCLCHWPCVRDDLPISKTDESFVVLASLLLRDLSCDHPRVILYLATTLARIIPYAKSDRQKRMLLSMSTYLLKAYMANSFIIEPLPLEEPC